MTTIKATAKAGRIDVRAPPDWPDGTEVRLEPVEAEIGFGVPEEEWSNSPEAIADWLAWYDSLEPLLFTDQERTAWET